jgi:hypothetical protein
MCLYIAHSPLYLLFFPTFIQFHTMNNETIYTIRTTTYFVVGTCGVSCEILRTWHAMHSTTIHTSQTYTGGQPESWSTMFWFI